MKNFKYKEIHMFILPKRGILNTLTYPRTIMKKNLKLLVSCVLIATTFSMPQNILGMDNGLDKTEIDQLVKRMINTNYNSDCNELSRATIENLQALKIGIKIKSGEFGYEMGGAATAVSGTTYVAAGVVAESLAGTAATLAAPLATYMGIPLIGAMPGLSAVFATMAGAASVVSGAGAVAAVGSAGYMIYNYATSDSTTPAYNNVAMLDTLIKSRQR